MFAELSDREAAIGYSIISYIWKNGSRLSDIDCSCVYLVVHGVC
jgi:hypothetical protein